MSRRSAVVLLILLAIGRPVRAQVDESAERLQFANGLYARGMYELAATEYEAYLTRNEKPAEEDVARFRLGECYLSQGDFLKAEKQFRTVFGNFPKSPYRLRAGFKRADVFVQVGRHEDAVALFSMVLKEKPDADLASACLYFSADSLVETGRAAEAVKVLERVQSQYAGAKFHSFALLKLGEFYARGTGLAENKADEDRALQMFRKAAEKPGSPRVGAEALFQVAEVYFRRRDYKQSSEAYRALLDRYPKDERSREAQLQAAWAQHNAGLYADALALADKRIAVLAATPQDPRAAREAPEWMYLKANCQRQLVKNDAAVKTYAELLARHPGSAFTDPARYERALTFYRMGDFTNAVSAARDVTMRGEMRKDVYWLLAESYASLKQKAEAVQYYRLIVRDFPESDVSGDAMYRLAYHLQEQEAYSEAARYYQQVAKKCPDRDLAPKALFASAFCLLKAGQLEPAVRDWGVLIKQYPKDVLVEESLYQKAMGETRLKRRDDAMATLRELLKRFPKSEFLADAHYWYGVHLAAGDADADAEKELRAALKSSPRHDLEREIRYNLAIVLQRSNKFEESAKLLQDLLATDVGEKFTPDLLEWLATYQIEKGRFDDATRVAGRLQERHKDPSWQQRGWGLRGRAALAKGDRKAADESYQLALAMKATTPFAAEAALRLGEGSLADGKADAATKFFRRATALARDESQRGIRARATMGLARAAEKAEDLETAARYYMSIAVLYEDPALVPESLFAAAAAFDKLGKKDESSQALAELTERYPKSPWAERKIGERP